jgi:lysophospholipase L1-like esterase
MISRKFSLAFAATLAFATTVFASPMLYMAGDSTMSDRTPDLPERGWGQLLKTIAKDPASVDNSHSVNGRSTKNFISEKRWEAIVNKLKAGDFVIIQFGHNDAKKEDAARFTAPREEYRTNLLRFIADVKAKGAEPILATPICRRRFSKEGKLSETHGDYPVVVREVAAEQKVFLLDLGQQTYDYVANLGPEGSKKFFCWVEPGAYSGAPKGKQDDTHLQNAGALKIAEMAVQDLRDAKHPLAELFK